MSGNNEAQGARFSHVGGKDTRLHYVCDPPPQVSPNTQNSGGTSRQDMFPYYIKN